MNKNKLHKSAKKIQKEITQENESLEIIKKIYNEEPPKSNNELRRIFLE